MRNEIVGTTDRAAKALACSITDRLETDEMVGSDVFRACRTLATLVRALADEGHVEGDLRAALDRLFATLSVRVGEAIDCARDDETYDLGRSMEAIAVLRRNFNRLAG